MNEKQNISIYSRISEQRRCIIENIVDYKLANGEIVYCVNNKYLGKFLLNLEDYFINEKIETKESELEKIINDKSVLKVIRSLLIDKQLLLAVQKLVNFHGRRGKKIDLKDALDYISLEYKTIQKNIQNQDDNHT
jgi:hypothetical protein